MWGFLKIRGTLLKGFYRGYIGIMDKRMDTTIQGLGFPKIKGTLYGGPYNKDYSILVSILGSSSLGKLPC